MSHQHCFEFLSTKLLLQNKKLMRFLRNILPDTETILKLQSANAANIVLLQSVLGRMPPEKMPPGKMPPGKLENLK